MGLRFRRSLKLMPGIRINFGLRGVSATIGVPGASVNFGSRGTFLNTGIPGTGVSYRTRIGGGTRPPPADRPTTDDSSDSGWPIQPPTYSYKSAPIAELGTRSLDRFVALLAESKIRRELIASKRAEASNRLRWAEGYLSSLLIGLRRKISPTYVQLVSAYRDETTDYIEDLEAVHTASRLHVDFDLPEAAGNSFVEVTRAFEHAKASERVWDVTTGRRTDQRGERTVASEAIERVPVRLRTDNDELLEVGHQVPVLTNANGADVLIYPAFLVARASAREFTLIDLRTVRIQRATTHFHETDGVPTDSQVVGHTWAKANKDGSRDRRFADNSQIPVAAYELLTLSSAQGLLERWMFSNRGAAEAFADSFTRYQKLLPRKGADEDGDAPPEVSELAPLELPSQPKAVPTNWRELGIGAAMLAAAVVVFVLTPVGQQTFDRAYGAWLNRGALVRSDAQPPQTFVQSPSIEPTQAPEVRALTRDEVVELQTFLSSKGYYTSTIDGIAGRGTRNATLRYLSDQKRPTDFADDTRILEVIREQ